MRLFAKRLFHSRNSPHNFKKQNTEGASSSKGQELMASESKFTTSFVQFSIPQFSGIVSVETKVVINKPKTSLEKFENLFNFPIF